MRFRGGYRISRTNFECQLDANHHNKRLTGISYCLWLN